MTAYVQPRWMARLRAAVRAIGAAVVGLGLLVLFAWWAGVDALKSFAAGWATMKPITALGLATGGLALLAASYRRTALARTLGIALAALATLITAQQQSGVDLGIDQFLVGDVGDPLRGWPAPMTAVTLAALGVVFALHDVRRGFWLVQALILFVTGLSLVVVATYLYGVQSLYAIGMFQSMALHTALGAFALGLGAALARPGHGLAVLLASDTAGGAMARWLLPAALVLPLALGGLRLAGERTGWYGLEFGLALFASANAIGFTVLVLWAARKLFVADQMRQAAETVLRANDERHRRSQIYANIGTWEWDIPTGALHWSERIGPLFGYGTELTETTYENFLKAVHPDDRANVIAAVNAAVERNAPYDIEHRVLWPDGTVRWVQETGGVDRDPDGQPQHMLGVVQDITRRKQAEVALRESEARFRQLTESIPEVFWLVSPDWSRVLYISPAYEKVWGRSCASLYQDGRSWIEAVHPDDRAMLAAALGEIVVAVTRGRQSAIVFPEYRILRPDGSVRWIEAQAAVIHDDQGHPVRVAGIAADVTARKRVEQAIQNIAAGVASMTGEAFFREFVSYLSKLFDARYAFIGTLDEQDPMKVHTLALSVDGRVATNLSYFLAGTPCANVVGQRTCVYPDHVQQSFPEDALLCQLGAESYIGTPLFNADGKPLGLIVVLDDKPLGEVGMVQPVLEIFAARAAAEIQRQRTEVELRHVLTRSETVLRATRDGFFVVGPDARLREVSDIFCRMLGYTAGELLQLSISDIEARESAAEVAAHIEKVLKEGYDLFETRHRRKDGTAIDVEISVSVAELEGERLFFSFVRDIGTRKRTEAVMRQLTSAVEQTGDAIAITDVDGRIEYVNAAFEHMTGYTGAEAIGRTPRLLSSGRQGRAYYERLWTTILEGETFRGVFVNRRKDGSLYHEEKVITPIRDDSGRIAHFVSAGRDIDQRLAHEQTHRETLIREVHHRIKNNLQGVVGLLRQHAVAHPDVQSALDVAIAQVMTVAMVHGLQGRPDRRALRLCDMAEAICRSVAGLTGATIESVFEPPSVGVVHIPEAEAVPLALILNELVFNAVKHGRPLPGAAPVHVQVRAEPRCARIVVETPRARLPEGFDLATGRGLGTGLSLVKSLLPHEQAQLRLRNVGDAVVAELVLWPPIVELSGAATPTPAVADDCMDAGGRATPGAVAETDTVD